MWRSVIPALVLGAVLVGSASAQQLQDGAARPAGTAQQAPAGPPPFLNVRGFSPDYQVGPGDLLDIVVVGLDDLHQSLRISNTGEISYPMLGTIKVADLTAFEVEAEVARRLREKGLVQQPEALVSITEYQAKPVYVSGAVTNAGEFIMSQELTVLDAILLAGGLRYNAADEALLHRRVSADAATVSPAAITGAPNVARPGFEIVKVDIRPLKQGRFLEASIPLRRGDVLVVPDLVMNPFFVVGEVIAPKNYFYPPGLTLMASQAISWAGGPLPTAKMSAGMLVRFDAQGHRTEMKVDYAAILRGKEADFPIQP